MFRSPWYFRVDGPGREASESCMEDHFVLRLDDLIESMDCRDTRYLSHPSSSEANFRIVLKAGKMGDLSCWNAFGKLYAVKAKITYLDYIFNKESL